MSAIITVFHAFVLLHHLCLSAINASVDYRDKTTDPEILKFQTYAWRYVTNWNILLQLVYFSMVLFEDFFPRKSPNKYWSAIKVYFFTSVVFPTCLFVTVKFWCIFHVNREFIFPVSLSRFIPDYMNHMAHTIPAIFAIIEATMVKNETINYKIALFILLSLNTVYYFMYFLTFIQTGLWLYNVHKIMNWNQRIIYTVINVCLSCILMKTGLKVRNVNIYLRKTIKLE